MEAFFSFKHDIWQLEHEQIRFLSLSVFTYIDRRQSPDECIFDVLHFFSSDQERTNERTNTLKAFGKHAKAHEQQEQHDDDNEKMISARSLVAPDSASTVR